MGEGDRIERHGLRRPPCAGGLLATEDLSSFDHGTVLDDVDHSVAIDVDNSGHEFQRFAVDTAGGDGHHLPMAREAALDDDAGAAEHVTDVITEVVVHEGSAHRETGVGDGDAFAAAVEAAANLQEKESIGAPGDGFMATDSWPRPLHAGHEVGARRRRRR